MKKIKFIRLAICFAVLFFSNAIGIFAQDYEYTTVPNDPLNARVYVLKNGLTVYMTVYKDEPRIQTYIATKAGSKNDPSDATGLAHYFEHMMFKGSNHFGTTDYAKESVLITKIDSLFEIYRKIDPAQKAQRDFTYHLIDSISTEASKYAIPNEYDKLMSIIGAKGTNAYTSLEQTVYVEDIPSNQLDNWLRIESDRFSKPVLRLFHTELETIYEEYNMTITNDDTKVYFAILKGLFKNHTYGTQTVIGTPEHLKSPSMTRINEYYSKYYVPNNMAIALSGDFDPEIAIRLIDQYFGQMSSKPVPEFSFKPENEITTPEEITVTGPEAESVSLAYRLPGTGTYEADLLTIFDMILANSAAGIIDLDLVQKQKVLSAMATNEQMKDYSFELLSGKPKEGQTLEQVKDLLLEQIEKIKRGEFEDWLIDAIITDLKLSQTKSFEKNESRAQAFVESFTTGQDWGYYVERFDRYKKIDKKQILDFAKKYFNNNYVLIYKKTGKDENNTAKIKKPKITKIKINRDDKSDFLKDIESKTVKPIEPVFLDYNKDIQTFKINNLNLSYVRNTENKTFSLYYIFDMGTRNDKKIGIAVDYLKFLGTKELTSEKIKQEFFKLGCSFDVFSSDDQVYVSLSGLTENINPAMKLFENLLLNASPNKEALDNMIKDELTERANAKKDQQEIFSRMVMYGIYGKNSPVTHILREDELKALTPDELTQIINKLTSYYHRILYYGSNTPEEIKELIKSNHKVPENFLIIPTPSNFTELPTDKNVIYHVDYDMKQVMMLMLSRSELYDKSNESVIKLYNEYFGGSMNSIVFQELRESRALAYAAMSFYQNILRKKENHFYNLSFIMTQADKLPDAMAAFEDLSKNFPDASKSFELAKNSIVQNIQSERITKTNILFNYENAKDLGLTYDIRQDIYKNTPGLTFTDVKSFQEKNIKDKTKTILLLGDKKAIDFKAMKKYGKVKTLSLEEIFGY
jgi:predicted Zn-dependent peptidase